MAWSWSHTQEAYDNAEKNLYDLRVADVMVIWAEWEAAEPREYGGFEFNDSRYTEAHAEATAMVRDGLEGALYDMVWRRAEDLATCDNGGWNAWLCPFGCGCHTVPFDRENERE